ncbi:MAG: hypothetical protein RR681_07900 [Lachnospiraceae bacterium]
MSEEKLEIYDEQESELRKIEEDLDEKIEMLSKSSNDNREIHAELFYHLEQVIMQSGQDDFYKQVGIHIHNIKQKAEIVQDSFDETIEELVKERKKIEDYNGISI